METRIKIGQYVIVRTQNAGVFAGVLAEWMHDCRITILQDARRIWFWQGAASLSELAVRGTSKPAQCKFPAAVPEVQLCEVIEILYTTGEARQSIESVPVWTE